MDRNRCETAEILAGATGRELEALGELMTRHEDRLRRMIELRMDRRLHGRIDASDVIQETYLEASRSFSRYLSRPEAPFYLWLRCIAGRRLISLQRYHLGAQARDVRREVRLFRGAVPEATSEAIASRLLGQLTSPSEAAMRSERRMRLQAALNAMEPIDREVLVLRHFEQLSNAEVAQVLGIEESAASKRHLRALRRLKDVLKTV